MIRTSHLEGPTYRRISFQCVNVDGCGSTFGGSMEVTHRIAAGVAPNPAVNLRTSPPRSRAANDDLPKPANDGEGGSEVPLHGNDNDTLSEATG